MSAPYSNIRFGTDGWRAVMAEEFTFANVRAVAQATAEYFRRRKTRTTRKRIVVGYDRRFLSDEFAMSVAEVLAGNGYEVMLTNTPTPTPAVSWMVKAGQGRAGVMLTASHNPARFNGYKLKLEHGGPADPETCRGVEALIGKHPVRSMPFKMAHSRKLIRVEDIRPRYYRALRKLVNFKLIAKSGLRFGHEALFGVGAGCFEELLEGTNCEVTTFNSAHDPNFGGICPEPIERNYTATAEALRRKPVDFCLVTDGDADRIGGMDGRGNALTTHQIICLLLEHFIVRRQGQGRVVKALTTTSMVDVICRRYDLELTETGVGFKYICEEMLRDDVLLGFEESGGVGFPNHIPERDGLLAGLMMLELLATEKQPLRKLLSRLDSDFSPHRYGRLDTHFPLDKRNDLMGQCAVHPPKQLLGSPVERMQTFDGVKYTARNGCWLMLRGSGTEPVLRIYAEAPTEAGVDQLLMLGQKLARAALR
ncbi:MAG: phosphoglucomutase/phosphomannomutase family protein [Verrucomicrobia subdivision 3 bacterium]|nr:phosphoglucomutase/phosphomannomutase family protein [Limisphaerales bacterium]